MNKVKLYQYPDKTTQFGLSQFLVHTFIIFCEDQKTFFKKEACYNNILPFMEKYFSFVETSTLPNDFDEYTEVKNGEMIELPF